MQGLCSSGGLTGFVDRIINDMVLHNPENTTILMSVHQLSFWDNEALETGYRYLAALELDEASVQFGKVLKAGLGEMESVQKLIDCCRYWQPVLRPSPEDTPELSRRIKRLLKHYLDYHFIPQMASFKKALLYYVIGLLHNDTNIDFTDAQTAFDLLLGMGDLEKAEGLASYGISQDAENHLWLYLLAQAQWLSGKRSEANYHYVTLLLCHPKKLLASRIENRKLQELINAHGPGMAPAYGWLRNILPFVQLPGTMNVCDEEHRTALESYRLLQQAERSRSSNDMKSCIDYRKQLKTIAPNLYNEYFRRLRQ